jgi:hypothetical protein
MKLQIQLSEEVKQELDSMNEKFDTELLKAKKDLKRWMVANLITKGVIAAASLSTVAWIMRDRTN